MWNKLLKYGGWLYIVRGCLEYKGGAEGEWIKYFLIGILFIVLSKGGGVVKQFKRKEKRDVNGNKAV